MLFNISPHLRVICRSYREKSIRCPDVLSANSLDYNIIPAPTGHKGSALVISLTRQAPYHRVPGLLKIGFWDCKTMVRLKELTGAGPCLEQALGETDNFAVRGDMIMRIMKAALLQMSKYLKSELLSIHFNCNEDCRRVYSNRS
ncbi:hypothetical protein RRG08_046544 [Elysia crispata]|uniref:Uncharacterized protein n=1 Tax=Elysia crispata TaxID=231223 RepID=A0AAE0Z7H7_9GAST|nr:hypothetical protein RRG08_046544 [Elysia crispata]